MMMDQQSNYLTQDNGHKTNRNGKNQNDTYEDLNVI